MSDALLDAARHGDVAAVGREVNELSEAERRKLASRVLRLLREVRESYIGRVRQQPWPYTGDPESVMRATQTLFLAVATAAEVRKAGPWGVPPTQLAIETLKHRPAVVAELVDAIADMPPTRWNSQFAVMRTLAREGVIEPPANPGYILAMINGLARPRGTILEALREDPGLLEYEVWRLFEVEGAGETSLAAHDKYTPEASSWSAALKTLSDEGVLSRARLLDDSLAALTRDFAPFRANWFSRFHEQLAPSVEERRGRESAYVSLLASPVPTTVSFAVRALLAAGSLSEANFDRLTPALMSKAIATVKGAIKLLPRTKRGASLAAAAVPHATRDGQAALLAFVNAIGPGLTPAPAAPTPVREFQPRAPATLRGPVETAPELIELLATLLEHVEDAHDIECAIDGTSRMCDRDDITLRRLDAVARRAAKVQSEMRAFAGESPRADIAGLVSAWAAGRVAQVPLVPGVARSRFHMAGRGVPGPRKSVLGFLSARVLEVADRAARGQRQPILSLPTSAGGAIEPEVLAARRNELARLRIKPAKADAIQAALRAGEVRPLTAVRFRYESPAAKYFELVVEPSHRSQPGLDDVPGLFAMALSPSDGGAADYSGVGRNGVSGLAEAVRWVSTVWPANRELFYAKGALDLRRNVDWWEAMWHVRCFLEPMLLPSEQIHEIGRLLLALGLAAKDPGEHSLATDVLINAVGERRVDARLLGDALGALYSHGEIKGSRIASTLSEACRVSGVHADAVATVLGRTVAGLRGVPPPPDLHAVLTTLGDALVVQGGPLADPDALAYLAGIEGTGKAAASARQLVSAAQR